MGNRGQSKKGRGKASFYSPTCQGPAVICNDNHCFTSSPERLMARSQVQVQRQFTDTSVNLNVVHFVHTAPGLSQKKEISPGSAACYPFQSKYKVKNVKGVSCVTQLSCANYVPNVKNAVQNLPVGASSKLLANLAGSGCRSESASNFERGLPPPLSGLAKAYKVSHSRKLLCQSPQGQLPVGGITSAYRQERSGTGSKSNISRVLQPTILGPKAQQQMETYTRSEQIKSLFLKVEKFKMETPETIRTSLQQGEWVTSIDFKDAYFHIPTQEQSRKYLRFHVQGQTYQFKALPFGLSTAPLEFTVVAKEVKLMAIHKGIRIHQYLDDWLVRARSHQICLQHTQILVKMCPDLGWLVNLEKSELEPKQVFNFVGYQFDLKSGRVRPTLDRWQNLQNKILELLSLTTCPVREFMSLIGLLTATEKQVHLGRLHLRPIQWHLKNNWRVPESLEKVIPIPRSLHPHLRWWLEEKNVLTGQPLHPVKHALQIFTGASKEGWGAHLNERTARGTWSLPESKLHINYLEIKAVFVALKEFQDLCSDKIVLIATDNTTVGQGRGHEVGHTLCSTVENLDLVYQESSVHQSPTHSRPTECGSRQDIQVRPDHPDRVVSPSSGLSSNMQQVASASNRPFCHQIQQVASVRVSSTGHHGHCSGCTQSLIGRSGCVCISTNSHIGQSGGKVAEHPMQKDNPDCPRVAKHDLALGPSDHVQSNSSEPTNSAQLAHTTLQSDPSQKSDKPEPACMAPRASAIKEQGFSGAVAARIEAPQRGSTRSVYEAKWTIFTKWCITNKVDFRAPPVKSSLCTCFRTGSYSPAPLMVTGLPLLINWEIHPLASAKMKISLVSWIVSTETDPKAREEFPPGTSPWFYTN